MEKGFIQVYTGDGKGKTTAALGLMLRAVCAGKKVIMLQFMKGMPTSELAAPALLLKFEIVQHGTESFVEQAPSPEDCRKAQEGLVHLREVLAAGKYGVVVADEFNCALAMGLFSLEDALAVLRAKRPETELLLTGRGAAPEIIALADLVTEMAAVKHYYNVGVSARVGIEL